MWHGGIHITDATTPWCALVGKAPQEVMGTIAGKASRPYAVWQTVSCRLPY
ncbi:hypothetical protein [Salmonella enterica]|uniref:hypothetical protein n=1 Tax=Salmonella enterica TaxID=28901 RepID=UPI0013B06D0A|nr:hypothetical protein [Salmonella enterica]